MATITYYPSFLSIAALPVRLVAVAGCGWLVAAELDVCVSVVNGVSGVVVCVNVEGAGLLRWTEGGRPAEVNRERPACCGGPWVADLLRWIEGGRPVELRWIGEGRPAAVDRGRPTY